MKIVKLGKNNCKRYYVLQCQATSSTRYLLAFMDHILHDQGGESEARCREVTREVVEDVTNHVMEKVCSLL